MDGDWEPLLYRGGVALRELDWLPMGVIPPEDMHGDSGGVLRKTLVPAGLEGACGR